MLTLIHATCLAVLATVPHHAVRARNAGGAPPAATVLIEDACGAPRDCRWRETDRDRDTERRDRRPPPRDFYRPFGYDRPSPAYR